MTPIKICKAERRLLVLNAVLFDVAADEVDTLRPLICALFCYALRVCGRASRRTRARAGSRAPLDPNRLYNVLSTNTTHKIETRSSPQQ